MKINKALSGKDICKIIMDNNLQQTFCQLDYDCIKYDEEKFNSSEEYLNFLGLRNFEEVEGVCNSDELYSVIHFKDQNVYIKITGEYDSYGNGDHYYDNEVIEVFPKQKTVTYYD